MATVTIIVAAEGNLPPVKIGRISIPLDYNELYPFTLADYTTLAFPAFTDPEGDILENIKILSLPVIGTLTINDIPAVINDVVSAAQLTAGVLEYQCDPADTDGYIDKGITYTASDVGSSTYSLDSGRVYIIVSEQITNSPPTVVGDGTMTLDYAEVGIFTRAMFTTGTSPAYSDPEGDPALYLKITGLPALGEIKLNGIPVGILQIINFDDIDLGLLTYDPDLADVDGDMQGFTFEVADVSGIYVG